MEQMTKHSILLEYYNNYVRNLEEDHDELLLEVKKLRKEISGLKKQVSFYKGRCSELEKIPNDKDIEQLESDRSRYRDLAQRLKKERDNLLELFEQRKK